MNIDVYILTGFLGAGKTTALNALLCGQMATANPALIINEFGKIGVDGAMVERRDLTRYEINKGSIFCICTKTDFLGALEEIAAKRQHSAVFIEATGIAETADIESLIAGANLNRVFHVKANLCVVDAANFTRVAAFLKTALTQVRCADAVILNKTDLASEGELLKLREMLQELNPQAPLVLTKYGKVSDAFLGGLVHRPAQDTLFEQPPADITAVSIGGNDVYDRAGFYQVLETFKEQLLRLKGHVRFGEGLRFVELAGTELSESEPIESLGTSTAFTAICWKLDSGVLRDAFLKCRQGHSSPNRADSQACTQTRA